VEKTTKIIGHFRDIIIVTTEGDKLDLPKGVTLHLKDNWKPNNLTLEITILPTTNTKTYTGHYTITIKEP